MPTRSSDTRVLKWPDRDAVTASLEPWLARELPRHPDVVRVGYFGSYARGDWGVGSDLDLIVLVRISPLRFDQRALEWDILDLPVPTDLLVYTVEEWQQLESEGSRFANVIDREAVWLYGVSSGVDSSRT